MYTKEQIFEQHIDYLRINCKKFFVKAYPEENDKNTFKYVFIIKLGKPTLDKSSKPRSPSRLEAPPNTDYTPEELDEEENR